MTDRPALLGDDPIFKTKVPIVRPVLPSFADLAEDAEELLSTGMVTKGRHLLDFEEAVAKHLGVRNAVAVSSCTSGLMLTYKCLGLTGEVVIPSFTFMATASALVWAGLRPVFADVDFHTTNLDAEAAEAAITPDTSAIVAVHNFGNPADLEALQALADRRNLKLICDAAHGFGALYNGKPVGSQADAHVFSLSPTKLVIAGEGGIVATNDDELAGRIRMGREYGNDGKYDSAFPGINARLPEFNALMGLHSLRRLEAAARRRNAIALLYRGTLSDLPGIAFQHVRETNRHSYKDFSVTVDEQAFGLSRDGLALALDAENIDTRKYYDPPVHRQTAYKRFGSAADLLDNTDLLAARSLSLPMWSEMSDETALGICRAIGRIHEFAGQIAAALKQSTTASGV
ncbi:MAG: DegT/DnrJ/EryC1/StrS family aminotransferase [Acidobacteriota bacterium]